jgi:hypothetical protein
VNRLKKYAGTLDKKLLRETIFIGNFTTDLSNQPFIGDQESLVVDEQPLRRRRAA